MIVPHDSGSKVIEIKFDMLDDLEATKKLEEIKKPEIVRLEIFTKVSNIESA